MLILLTIVGQKPHSSAPVDGVVLTAEVQAQIDGPLDLIGTGIVVAVIRGMALGADLLLRESGLPAGFLNDVHHVIQGQVARDVVVGNAAPGSDDGRHGLALELAGPGKTLFPFLDGSGSVQAHAHIGVGSVDVPGAGADVPQEIGAVTLDGSQAQSSIPWSGLQMAPSLT